MILEVTEFILLSSQSKKCIVYEVITENIIVMLVRVV